MNQILTRHWILLDWSRARTHLEDQLPATRTRHIIRLRSNHSKKCFCSIPWVYTSTEYTYWTNCTVNTLYKKTSCTWSSELFSAVSVRPIAVLLRGNGTQSERCCFHLWTSSARLIYTLCGHHFIIDLSLSLSQKVHVILVKPLMHFWSSYFKKKGWTSCNRSKLNWFCILTMSWVRKQKPRRIPLGESFEKTQI